MKKKETFIAKYQEFELLHGRSPHSVVEFCKAYKSTEEEFYKHFSGLTQLRKEILLSIINETIIILDADDNYESYSGREQALAFFFTLVEELKSHRSYLQAKYATIHSVKEGWKDWEMFFRQFDARMEQVVLAAKQSDEIAERPIVGAYYAKSFRLTFTYIFRVWINDESNNFETTDAAIEKSVNLAFELLGKGALDSIVDFGRFALKTKWM